MRTLVAWFALLLRSVDNRGGGATASKLQIPSVLLPVFDAPFAVNHSITAAADGCYKWSASRGADQVGLQMPSDADTASLGCSGRVFVHSLSREPARKVAVVTAEDVHSGETVRCDVIFDTVASLRIVTKTRELFVGDAAELFEVSAFDSQGNQFTTLNGVEFKWSTKVLKHQTNTVINILSFKDSSYRTPPAIYELEQNSKRGNMVLIEGVKTGSAIVYVKLSSFDTPITQIELSVITNLRLEPSHVIILPGDLIQIDIYKIQNEKLVKIQQPSNQYAIKTNSSINTGLLKIKKDSGLFQGVEEGQVTLNVMDYYIESKNKSVSCFVNISKAEYLLIVIKPYNQHNLIINDIYELEVYLYDNYNQSINIGSNVKIVMHLPEEYFKVISITNNGTYAIIQPIKLGILNIEALLVDPYYDSSSSAKKTISIYSKVKVTPDEIIFPWHQNKRLKFSLAATGGDEEYSWNSNDETVVTVSSSGLVMVQGLGRTYVSAAMARHSINQGSTNIYVLNPDYLNIIAQPAEQEVGMPIVLYIQIFVKLSDAKLDASVTTCNHDQFKIEVEDSRFVSKHYNSPLLSRSCIAFSLSSEQVASTKVTVYFQTSSGDIKATVFISTYKKLQLLLPESKRTVLALGCAITLLFYGGPQPSSAHGIGYNVEFETNKHLVEFQKLSVIHDIDGHKTHAYSIVCRNLGSTRANLTIKNILIINGFESETISQTTVEVLCALPKSVNIFTRNCPITKSSNNIFAYIHEKLHTQINVIDEGGNIFNNATTLNSSWVIENSDIVKVVNPLVLNEITKYGFTFPNYHYSVLQPLKDQESSTVAIFQLIIYKKSFKLTNNTIIDSFFVKDEKALEEMPTIKYSISIFFFDDPLVTHAEMLVIHNPTITKSIYIYQGSGYFKIHLSTQNVAKVSHGGRRIDITPLAQGDLFIGIEDLCIKSKRTEAIFKVRYIHRMELLTNNTFVEIGGTISAIVQLYDSEGYPLSIEKDVLDIRPVVEANHILTIKPKSRNPEQIYDIEFSIEGSSIGKTIIYFVADNFLSKEIRTPITSIKVYPKLKLSPKNLVLAVGSRYQLIVSGGPHFECVYEFTSDDEQIIKVSNRGIVKGLNVGTAIITGLAVDFSLTSGVKVLYSKDIIKIRVIKLNNIKIEVPLLKLKVGDVMPAWVRGVPDPLSPIIIGTIQPSLIFHWTTSFAGIVQIYDILENTGIQVREQDRISIRIRAVRTGTTKVGVSVSDPSSKLIFTNYIDITVYKELCLISHNLLNSNSILATPNTELLLMTNQNKMAQQTVQIIGSPKLNRNRDTLAISIDQDFGTVKTTNDLGRAHISIISTENFGVEQSLDVLIEVKRVHYIMINVETNLKLKEPSQMPVPFCGMNLKLITSYHDEKGVQFNAINSDLKYLTSHQNEILVTPGDEKHTLEVSLFESDEVMLKIWDERIDYFNEDYIKFHVEHLIYPNKVNVTVGDVICFLMPIKVDAGEWLTNNLKTLAINSSSGLSLAMAPSEVIVTYSSNKFTTYTRITILPIKTIVILPLEKTILSNSAITDIQLIILNDQESILEEKYKKGNMWEWYNDDCSNRETPIKHFPYMCDVKFESIYLSNEKIPSINSVFNVGYHFNTQTGLYSCQLIPLPIINQELSLFQAKIVIQVLSGSVVTEFKDVEFLPSVYINKNKLFFSQLSGNDKLIIIGLPQVLKQIEVTSSNGSLVLPILSSSSKNEIVYAFDVSDDFWNLKHFDFYIVLTSNLTYQKIKIHILTTHPLHDYDLSGMELIGFSNSIFSNPYIIGVVIIIIIFSLIIYCYGFSFNKPIKPHNYSFQSSSSETTNVSFYNRSYLSYQNNSSSLIRNRYFTRTR